MASYVEKNAAVILSMREAIARDGGVMVNRQQCVEMVGELQAVSSALVKHQGAILNRAPSIGRQSPLLLLREIYRVATIADGIVGECCGSASTWGKIRWIEAAVRQVDNQSAFKHVVNELRFCADLLAKEYRGHWISDIFRRLATKMRPPTNTSFFNDHEQLLSKLRTITTCSTHLDDRKEKLVRFLQLRVYCIVRRARQSSSLSSSSSFSISRHQAAPVPDLPTEVSETYAYIKDGSFQERRIRMLGEGKDGFVDALIWADLECARKSSRILPRPEEFGASEADIVARLRHFNVIKLFFQLQYCDTKPPVIVMELMTMSLEKFIKNRYKPPGKLFSLLAKIDTLLQMCYGMQYIHGLGILHLDFKPGNVLVNPCPVTEFEEEGYTRVKIADFGSARSPVQTSSSVDNDFQLPGTTPYRAPEVTGITRRANEQALDESSSAPRCCWFPDQRRDQRAFRVSRRADVFSWALTCAEILTGKTPYEGVPMSEIQHRKTKKNERPELPPDLPPDLKSLLVECWSTNPKTRPNFEKIVERLLKLKASLLTQSGHSDLDVSDDVVDSPAPILNPSLSVKCKSWGFARLGKELTRIKLPYLTPSINYYSHGGPKRFVYKDIKLTRKLRRARDEMCEDVVSRIGGAVCGGEILNTSSSKVMMKKGCKYGATYEADIRNSATGAIRLHAVRKIPTTVIDLQALWQMERIDHPNIARLLGWCTNKANLLLVYEWVERRDLRTNLQDVIESRHLTWRVRQKILIGVASGLRYLHDDCGLVHHRVKATNVLLGNDNTAILRDGGLALLVAQNPHKWDQTSRARHHLAPELPWYKEHTKATDVFGFGILVLEVVCGRRPDMLNNDGKYLADWVWHSFADCHYSKQPLDEWVERVVDHSSLFGDYDTQEVTFVLCVGLLCCHPDLNARPTMSKVEQVLIDGSGLLDILHQVPPKKPLVQYGSSPPVDDDVATIESASNSEPSENDVVNPVHHQTPMFRVTHQPKLKLD